MTSVVNNEISLTRIDDVLRFWFGELDHEGCARPSTIASWWKTDEAFDQSIREQFGALHAALMKCDDHAWMKSARGRLATIIVLDQFSRNMFRQTANMFAADSAALSLARFACAQGDEQQLPGEMRSFLYLPLMHSENLTDQNDCVMLFTAYRDQSRGTLRERLDNGLRFAIQHRDIIQRFGRFPHRNALLGRRSTPEEEAFLKLPGSSF